MKWTCTVCGYTYEGPEPPAQCPQCKVPADKFRRPSPGYAVYPVRGFLFRRPAVNRKGEVCNGNSVRCLFKFKVVGNSAKHRQIIHK